MYILSLITLPSPPHLSSPLQIPQSKHTLSDSPPYVHAYWLRPYSVLHLGPLKFVFFHRYSPLEVILWLIQPAQPFA